MKHVRRNTYVWPMLVACAALCISGATALAQLPSPIARDLDSREQYERALMLRQRTMEMIEVLNGSLGQLRKGMFTDSVLELMDLNTMRVEFDLIHKRTGGFVFLGQIENKDTQTQMRAWLRAQGGEFLDQNFDLIIDIEPMSPWSIDNIDLNPTNEVPVDLFRTWKDVDAALEKLEYASALSVWEVPRGNGPLIEIHRYNADETLSIGTTSSLFIIEELVARIQAGDAAWDHVYPMQDQFRSFPLTPLAQVAQGTDMPLLDLALGLMQQSDSTGFDHLVGYLGREGLTRRMAKAAGRETEALEAMNPFLSTVDLFRMKCNNRMAPVNRYAKMTPQERRTFMKEELPELMVQIELFNTWERPVKVKEVGWFATTDALSQTMARLWKQRLDPDMNILREIMTAPKRVPWDHRYWEEFWFEQAGEPGAACAVWAMRRTDGREFIMTFVFNSSRDPLHDAIAQDVVFGASEILRDHR